MLLLRLSMIERKNIFFITCVFSVFFVGIIYAVLPHGIHYAVLREQGENYIPVTLYNSDVIRGYAPRYRDIIDGKIISNETDTYEYKDGPAVRAPLPPMILAPFFILFETIFPGMIITDFVFPISTFLLFFLFINALSRHRFFALFSALWIMFYASIVMYIPPFTIVELKVLILRFFPFLVDKVPMSPKFLLREAFIPGAPFFILSLYFTYKAVSAETKKKLFTLLAGIFYGLLFYLYFYFWIFITIFLGLLLSLLFLKGKRDEAIKIFLAGIIGIFVSIPFWINYFNLASLLQYNELIERTVGKEVGYGFRFDLWMDYLVYVAIAILVLWLGEKLKTPIKALFLAALALAGIVVLNLQVLSGFNVQSDHWFSRVFIITHNIIAASVAYDLFLYFKPSVAVLADKYRTTLRVVFFVAVLYFSAGVLYNQTVIEKRVTHNYKVPGAVMKSYEWLNQNTPNDSVIMTPSLETNVEVPVYTHNRIFLTRAYNSLASDEELLDRLYITYKLFGVTAAYLDEMIQSYDGVFHFFMVKYFGNELDAYLRRGSGGYMLPRAVREKVLNEYTFFEFPEQIQYKIDYLFVGPREKSIGLDEQALSRYKKVYNSNEVEIYQWKR